MPNFYLASAAALLGPPLLYMLSLALAALPQRNWSAPAVLLPPLLLMGITVAAHYYLVLPGYISNLSLPLGWALALVPHYIYSYRISRPGFFGRKFTFQILGMLFVAPPALTAVVCSLVSFFQRRAF